MNKLLLFIFFFNLFVISTFSQSYKNLYEKELISFDSIFSVDSLSIISGSLFIFDSNGNLLNDSLYNVDCENSIITFKQNYNLNFPLKLTYRVIPIDLKAPYYHKKQSEYLNKKTEFLYKSNNYQTHNNTFNSKEDLIKSGSISRGISFGNNQDVIVNSNMNLQLSGKLSDRINIIAAISDNNIPIQPDGNTQQIQEFDKIFISLFDESNKLTVGDFEINKPYGYFLNTNKKVQGIKFQTENKSLLKNHNIKSEIAGAVSKGQYCRTLFNGIEGNQGPYKLKGCNNELYIIILSGSEKVFIDGKLLVRGQNNDYVIDYNTGELSFTTNQIITKDKRIVIEFEYSDKNYARFTVNNSNILESKKSKYWINIFSESDSKNQTLQQDLSESQKMLLSEIGDSIQNAFVPNIDTVEFINNLILYQKIDSVVDGISYLNIYRYSNNPDFAIYRLGFSYVGKNRGNYEQQKSTANGKVYKWIKPLLDGTPQGSYEPIVLLISPKKKQMITFGAENKITKTLISRFETAISNNDINTFSNKDSKDNTGVAFKYGILKKFNVSDTNKISFFTSASYEFVSSNFTEIETFRAQEFNRDWNRLNLKTNSNEQLFNYHIFYNKINNFRLRYDFDYFSKNTNYQGLKNTGNMDLNFKGFNLNTNASYLISSGINNTTFFRNKNLISKNIAKFQIGISQEQEINKWEKINTDSLYANSFMFNVYEIYFKTNDSLKTSFIINYNTRDDYNPNGNNFKKITNGKNINIGLAFNKNPNQNIRLTANYRKLQILDSISINQNTEDNINGRVEYSSKFLKGVLVSNIFYELGTGLELKREFSYIEVAQGQGVFSWTDYNGNNIKDIDEFEVAAFQDQANYIRIFTPTNEYVKTYNNQYNHTLNILPQKVWFNKKGLRKLISRFSNNTAFRVNKKITNDDFYSIINPFSEMFNANDSNVVSINTSARNNLSFNRANSKWGIDYILQSNKNKMLLINGFDTRYLLMNGIKVRWNINSLLTLQEFYNYGEKQYHSEFFSNKNYNISQKTNEASLDIQTNLYFRISLKHKYGIKNNTIGVENSETNDAGIELKLNSPKKGNFLIGFNYIKINYSENPSTSIAYEMLEGLLPGNNLTWSVGIQQNISESLQLNLTYLARKPNESRIIHTGGVQLRAFF